MAARLDFRCGKLDCTCAVHFRRAQRIVVAAFLCNCAMCVASTLSTRRLSRNESTKSKSTTALVSYDAVRRLECSEKSKNQEQHNRAALHHTVGEGVWHVCANATGWNVLCSLFSLRSNYRYRQCSYVHIIFSRDASLSLSLRQFYYDVDDGKRGSRNCIESKFSHKKNKQNQVK